MPLRSAVHPDRISVVERDGENLRLHIPTISAVFYCPDETYLTVLRKPEKIPPFTGAHGLSKVLWVTE
jgi:hypothetical protein